MKTKIWAFSLFCLLTGLELKSQNATVLSGGDIHSQDGSISFSLGLPFYRALESASGSITQGVQHSYDFVTVGTEQNHLVLIDMSVYPNPVSDVVFLNVKADLLPAGLKYHIYDNFGKLLIYDLVITQQTQVDLKTLPPSSYYLTVFDSNRIYQSFQVIKN